MYRYYDIIYLFWFAIELSSIRQTRRSLGIRQIKTTRRRQGQTQVSLGSVINKSLLSNWISVPDRKADSMNRRASIMHCHCTISFYQTFLWMPVGFSASKLGSTNWKPGTRRRTLKNTRGSKHIHFVICDWSVYDKAKTLDSFESFLFQITEALSVRVLSQIHEEVRHNDNNLSASERRRPSCGQLPIWKGRKTTNNV